MQTPQARLKTNFQLSELVAVDGYAECIDLAATFTIQSLQAWKWASNSIHYLLSLWERLIQSIPYVKSDRCVSSSPPSRNHLGLCLRAVAEWFVLLLARRAELPRRCPLSRWRCFGISSTTHMMLACTCCNACCVGLQAPRS